MKMGTVLVLVVVLGALVWAVGWGPWQDISLARILVPKAGQAPEPVPPKAEEKSVAAKAPAQRVRAKDASPAPTEAPVSQAALQPEPAKLAPAPRKFPTDADLPVGTRGSRIEAAFGPPVARTVAVDQNGQIEVLIYRRADPAAVTFVHLKNGQVISSSTMNY